MKLYFEHEPYLEGVALETPNAVLNIGVPLTFRINTISKLGIIQEPTEWNLKYAKLYQDNNIFVDNTDLNENVKNNSTIEFPHDLFSSSGGDLVTGPVSLELIINFPESENLLYLNGTIFFYGCEDINDDFNLVECRWPEQLIGEIYYVRPC